MSKTHEDETRMFWKLSRMRAALPADDDGTLEAELRDEFEVLRDYTDSPRLKARCSAEIAHLAPFGFPVTATDGL